MTSIVSQSTSATSEQLQRTNLSQSDIVLAYFEVWDSINRVMPGHLDFIFFYAGATVI
jgi:hypothetical protein